MRLLHTGMVLALMAGLPVAAEAQGRYPWLVRTRGLAVVPIESGEASGGTVAFDPSLGNAGAIEADLGYRFSGLLSAELGLFTSGHEVNRFGSSDGSLQMLLPSLLVQVHPFSSERLDPYVGAGGNVAFFYENTGALRKFRFTNGVGWVVQAGCDLGLGERVLLNLDVKYASVSTDLRYSGVTAGVVHVNPVLVGLGFGYRF